MHTLFEQFNIFLSQGTVDIYVIVKTVIDNRTNRHFGIWPQLLDRMTQQMSTGVANNFQTRFIFGSDDG